MNEIPTGPRADAALQRMFDTLYGNGREGLTITVATLKEAVIEIKDQIKEAREDIRQLRAQKPQVIYKPMSWKKTLGIISATAATMVGVAKLLYDFFNVLKQFHH